MKESLLNLDRFIQDFDLRSPNGTIYFNAKIYFQAHNIPLTRYSEICIITSDNLAALYFLNAELSKEQLPDMFDLKHTRFVYIARQYIKIESNGYTISIFPQKNRTT